MSKCQSMILHASIFHSDQYFEFSDISIFFSEYHVFQDNELKDLTVLNNDFVVAEENPVSDFCVSICLIISDLLGLIISQWEHFSQSYLTKLPLTKEKFITHPYLIWNIDVKKLHRYHHESSLWKKSINNNLTSKWKEKLS